MQTLNIEKYRVIWLKQLVDEYEEICWSYGVDLELPVFEISSSTAEIGSWRPASRTIRLSAELIRVCSWSVTLQVLKHEMAHQLCSEEFNVVGDGHGQDFQRACELLGVEPRFRRSQSSLTELLGELEKGSNLTESGRRFISKIEKLLALARSPNENEASLAMQKANELLEKYNLQSAESGTDHGFSYVVINRKKKRIESYQRYICSILNDFFFVKIMMSCLYDPLTDQSYKTIELLGTEENVTIGEYCYHFLENKLETLWAYNRHKYKGSTRREKNSYYLGLLAGFHGKLKRQKEDGVKGCEPQKEDEKALILVASERKLEGYVSRRFPRQKKVSRKAAKIYRTTYADGVETGKTITLAKGVGGEAIRNGKLLTEA